MSWCLRHLMQVETKLKYFNASLKEVSDWIVDSAEMDVPMKWTFPYQSMLCSGMELMRQMMVEHQKKIAELPLLEAEEYYQTQLESYVQASIPLRASEAAVISYYRLIRGLPMEKGGLPLVELLPPNSAIVGADDNVQYPILEAIQSQLRQGVPADLAAFVLPPLLDAEQAHTDSAYHERHDALRGKYNRMLINCRELVNSCQPDIGLTL